MFIYSTFLENLDQVGTSFMIRTVNGVNKNQLHLPSDIGLELYANSIRIKSEIEDMDLDRTLHL